MKDVFEKTAVLGVRIDLITVEELIHYIFHIVLCQKKSIITYVNIHAVTIACHEAWFKDFINQSQIVFCDGYGVKLAANFLNKKLLNRFTPPDWFGRLAKMCCENGITLFLLGTQPEIVEKAALVMTEKNPGLVIKGFHHGFFNKELISSDNQEVVNEINSLCPDILIVGFGMPTQEKWILDNWDQLHVKVVIPVGAGLDYISGEVERAPQWMTDNGFEWLGRLLIEPRRLWRRYLFGTADFIWMLFLQSIGAKKFD